MPGLSWLYIIFIAVLVILSAFFSSTETAFASLNQFKIKVKAEAGSKTAKLILKTYEKFDKTLVMVLVGNNIVAVLVSTLSATLFFMLFKDLGISDTLVSLISTAVMTIIVYIFGDYVPKLIANAIPERVAYNNIYVALFFYILLYPLIVIFNLITKLVNKIFKTDEQVTLTEEDFTNVVEDIEKKGLIEDNESDIIVNSLDFTDTAVAGQYVDKVDQINGVIKPHRVDLPTATAAALGLVKVDDTSIAVNAAGVISVKAVSTDLLTQGTDELILDGGHA